MAQYTYSIVNDTLNGLFSGGTLEKKLREATITIALESVSTSADVITAVFKAALSTEEETELAGIIAAHTGMPEDVQQWHDDNGI